MRYQVVIWNRQTNNWFAIGFDDLSLTNAEIVRDRMNRNAKKEGKSWIEQRYAIRPFESGKYERRLTASNGL